MAQGLLNQGQISANKHCSGVCSMTTHRVAEAPTRADLEHFKSGLLHRREDLLKDIQLLEKEETQTAGTASGLSIHSADL
jgi:hypothetical protein